MQAEGLGFFWDLDHLFGPGLFLDAAPKEINAARANDQNPARVMRLSRPTSFGRLRRSSTTKPREIKCYVRTVWAQVTRLAPKNLQPARNHNHSSPFQQTRQTVFRAAWALKYQKVRSSKWEPATSTANQRNSTTQAAAADW